MNLDDLLCVGATTNFLLSSTIGRNKHLIPGEVCDRRCRWSSRSEVLTDVTMMQVISAVIGGTEKVLQMLRSHGVSITSTGMTMCSSVRQRKQCGAHCAIWLMRAPVNAWMQAVRPQMWVILCGPSSWITLSSRD